ncbi:MULTISPECIES: D-aminoacyl-tRNA deacylase [Dehalobacter]|uniref:D-aminoacyl-tRNA deacylase n=2 Tax=Dehalobacter restrictus TaxID=55583 RepID=A0A857DHG7_9FIRM|nr:MULTISPECIES: D-aminoacyl-tRNA deacylase [Dehalobacter]AHF10142.1 D-tyrosyl-tRNA(Tyr) deacylase [Dehalobacter restrictus DSM 9455]MCG1025031.1 D-tyrosyl-tRNA(Tyr) deacylase [Dehalobacter sp.]OCZ52595.1 D-tyrosyl-tRNA(Tyr) deacylase [Dehalobacter sp. TeCB1]QHA00744.1 D-tyrosyl-tRNA(Tyr) deacylase [Dehalobacter restrictus]
MRGVVQRVKSAAVRVENQTVGQIGVGLMVLIGIGQEDNRDDVKWLADKILNLRVFEDDQAKMNLSVADVGGELLLVSQFTLFGDCRKGRRPSFSEAAPPETARAMFESLTEYLQKTGIKVETGLFQADMDVELVNHGPVTLLLDSKKQF